MLAISFTLLGLSSLKNHHVKHIHGEVFRFLHTACLEMVRLSLHAV